MRAIENQQSPSFRHPDVMGLEVTPMTRAMALRRKINSEADRIGTHPFNVLMEQRLGQTDSALKAFEIKEHYMQRDGIVSDIHGLDEDTFGKLRESVLSQRFDRVFFLGDIGGSVDLADLQLSFYESFLNKYKALKKEGVDNERIFTEVRSGFLDLLAKQKHLEGYKHTPEDEIRAELEELTDEVVLQGIEKYGSYVHYGHYVSDQSSELISYLASDVESYYERFAAMIGELRTSGSKVYVIQGNWDARLPFDFEQGTEKPVPLPAENRRFNVQKFFEKHGIPYFTNLGAIESDESLDVMVPFDAVAKGIDEEGGKLTSEKINLIRKKIRSARRKGKTVSMMAHAVPEWTKHGKLPTGEGEVTQVNLQRLVAILNPDELVYGHEHFMRKDESGNPIDLNTKFKLHRDYKGRIVVGTDQEVRDLDKTPDGTIVSFAPKPTENYNAYSSREVPRWPVRNKRPRGSGGKAAPIHVGRKVVPIVRIDRNTNPDTERILYPLGRMKDY